MSLSITSAIVLSLPLFSSSADPRAAAPGDILAVVPEGCHQLAYCEDFAGLRSRAERNDWVKLMLSDKGDTLMEEMEDAYRDGLQLEPDDLYPIASELRGESVFFLAPGVAGFFTAAPEPRDTVRDALRSWLPDPGPAGVRNTRTIGVAQAELVAWPEESPRYGASRRGHFAALIEHPAGLGLVSADDLEILTVTLETIIPRLGSDQRSSVVQGFQSARKSAARTSGVELYFDFTPYAKDAERMLEQSFEGAIPDPDGMLGLEKGTWLYASVDVYPGRRIDGQGFLNIPQDTLASKLADTFGPLPLSLRDRLPNRLSALWALQWDMSAFYRQAREAFVAKHGDESMAGVDAGVEAVKGMTGVDPFKDVIANMDGLMAFYFAEPNAKIAGDERYITSFGFLLGLSNGEGFLSACEKLIDSTLESVLDLNEIEGAEVYTVSEDEWFVRSDEDEEPIAPGGVAFLPRSFVLCLSGDLLGRQIRALQQQVDSSLASDERLGTCLAEKSGVTFLSVVDLAWMHEFADMGGVRGPASDEAPARSPLAALEALLVSSARRTPRGFEFQLEVR